MKRRKEMDVVFLLDRSGSMSGCEADTIGGYNSYLEKQRNNGYNTRITTVLFDHEYELLNNRKEIENVKNLTKDEYFVRGNTALLDAIGRTIDNLDRQVGSNKVMFVITTDGYENASKEYDKSKIKTLIEKHSNWDFIYLGANVDSFSEGASLGIKKENISNYSKSRKGISDMFSAVDRACDSLFECGSIQEDWKKDLN